MAHPSPEQFDWKEILLHTSRSFAVGIEALDAPLDEYVGLCYLLCRLFDTYEDSTHVDPELRLRCLAFSERLLQDLARDPSRFESQLESWFDLHELETAWGSIDPWELKLLKEGPALWSRISIFPRNTRQSIHRALIQMVQGMIQAVKQQSLSSQSLRTLDDTDQYCYYVAGTVGLLLSDLFQEEFEKKGVKAHLAESISVGFGKALQLVNICKDFHADWREGRCYWPNLTFFPTAKTTRPSVEFLEEQFEKLSALLDRYLGEAQAYMDELRKLRAIRPDIYFFCAFPLEVAKLTLKKARGDHSWLRDPAQQLKIPREQTEALIAKLLAEQSAVVVFS